jgi:CubicO group peptidase (beta-lactamase class C family)
VGVAQATDEADVKARLNQVASSYTANDAFMGAVLVADGDRVLLDKAYGMASVEWNVPNSTDTKFRLGSITKQFTAALVLLMQQDGKLNISDPVRKYLPNVPKEWEKITLANLLGHTSGIPDFTSFREFAPWAASAHTWEEEYEFFKDKPLAFEPGSKYAYSNSDYILLGGILEKVSGKSYGGLLSERIFGPLGMSDSGLDRDDLLLPKRAEGYMPGQSGLIVARSESMSVPFSAGSIYSTTGDLLRWEHGLFGGKILPAELLRDMTTAGKGNYGLGVMIRDENGVKVVEHGGGIEGFNTALLYVPDRRACVVVLANVTGSAPGQIARQLLDVVLGKEVILNSERKPVPIANDELAKFVGTFDLMPGFSLAIALAGDFLTVQGPGQPTLPMMYQGMKDGHPRFFIAAEGAEIEFVPDASGAIVSLVLHHGGADIPGKKK